MDPTLTESRVRSLARLCKVEACERTEECDWDPVVAMALEQGLGAIVLKAAYRDRIPRPALDTLIANRRELAQRALLLIAELHRTADVLENAGIPSLVLKGPALAALAYGDATARSYRDIDLLVAAEAWAAAPDALMRAGFGRLDGLHRNSFAPLEMWHNEATFSTPSGKFVDLHWALAPAFLPRVQNDPKLWERSWSVSLGGRMMRTLSAEDALVGVSFEALKHGWTHLEWLVAIDRLARMPHLDWQQVLITAHEGGGTRGFLASLLVAKRMLLTPVPPAVMQLARSDRRVHRLGDQIEAAACGYSSKAWRLNLSAVNSRNRMGYLVKRLVTPSTSDLRLISLPDWASGGYFLIRPVRVALKYGSGRRLRLGEKSLNRT
jgi:Uncharacterised nucleotidyltransferase